jgi:hypothetical protein
MEVGLERTVGAGWDAMLYAGSAVAALVILSTSNGPLDQLWARVAVFGYGFGALAAWRLSRRGATVRVRAMLAVGVFAAVAVVPTILHADARLESKAVGMKSDVLIVEQAGESLLNGRNPYAIAYDQGPLARWPAATRNHFPYLPGIFVVGLARAAAGATVWTDARLVYLVVSLVIAVPSIMRSTASEAWRLRVFQVMFVLVTGAPLVFTSGKEVLVLALVLAGLVALQRGHAIASGVGMGMAAALHQLTWVIIPFIAIVPPKGAVTSGRRVAAIAASLAIAVVVPFLLWDAGAFIRDALLFPLGFGQPAGANGLTPGGLVASVGPDARWALILVMVFVTGIGLLVAMRRGVRTASDVARCAGTVLLVALFLAPRARLAYFALPANLLLWSHVLVRPETSEIGLDVTR